MSDEPAFLYVMVKSTESSGIAWKFVAYLSQNRDWFTWGDTEEEALENLKKKIIESMKSKTLGKLRKISINELIVKEVIEE